MAEAAKQEGYHAQHPQARAPVEKEGTAFWRPGRLGAAPRWAVSYSLRTHNAGDTLGTTPKGGVSLTR